MAIKIFNKDELEIDILAEGYTITKTNTKYSEDWNVEKNKIRQHIGIYPEYANIQYSMRKIKYSTTAIKTLNKNYLNRHRQSIEERLRVNINERLKMTLESVGVNLDLKGNNISEYSNGRASISPVTFLGFEETHPENLLVVSVSNKKLKFKLTLNSFSDKDLELTKHLQKFIVETELIWEATAL